MGPMHGALAVLRAGRVRPMQRAKDALGATASSGSVRVTVHVVVVRVKGLRAGVIVVVVDGRRGLSQTERLVLHLRHVRHVAHVLPLRHCKTLQPARVDPPLGLARVLRLKLRPQRLLERHAARGVVGGEAEAREHAAPRRARRAALRILLLRVVATLSPRSLNQTYT